jgi:hypothetical protein
MLFSNNTKGELIGEAAPHIVYQTVNHQLTTAQCRPIIFGFKKEEPITLQ